MQPSSSPTPPPQPLKGAADRIQKSAAPLRLTWSGITDRGRVRKNNEDAMAALTFDGHHTHYLGRDGSAAIAGGDFLFMVSDGMGGESLGEFASRTAIDEVAKLLPRSFRLSARGMSNDFQDILEEAVDAAHKTILKLGWAYEECWGMGTTLSLGWFTAGWMYFAHIGDSRVYHLPRAGALMQVSHDHNQAGWLRRKGQINEREARSHPTRHSLQQSLGAGNQFIDPQIGAVALQPGDRFLLCSDGLIDGLWDHHLAEMLAANLPLPELNRKMVELALENSGRDNTTSIVVEVGARDVDQPASL